MKENRKKTRTITQLKALVRGCTDTNETWKERTEVDSVSLSGSGLTLSRPCKPGRLLEIILPLPQQYRLYDHDDEIYCTLGLLQYCNPILTDGSTVYRVGVAFVGKQMPESYLKNPLQTYRIAGATESGTWNITETATDFQPRKYTRYWAQLEVEIALIQKEKLPGYRQVAKTVDISEKGAFVVCALEPNVGDRVKFASKELNFYAIAVVRNRRPARDGKSAIHLEFVDDNFPVSKAVPEPIFMDAHRLDFETV